VAAGSNVSGANAACLVSKDVSDRHGRQIRLAQRRRAPHFSGDFHRLIVAAAGAKGISDEAVLK